MKRATMIALLFLALLLPGSASSFAACDELVGGILRRHLQPVIKNTDCSIPGKIGLDKKDHTLVSVCYESTGPLSRIKVDTTLRCHASDESVVSKALGGKSTPSVSESVTVQAEARGADCKLTSVHVSPSGEISKGLASLFDVDGQARKALEQGLAEICKR